MLGNIERCVWNWVGNAEASFGGVGIGLGSLDIVSEVGFKMWKMCPLLVSCCVFAVGLDAWGTIIRCMEMPEIMKDLVMSKSHPYGVV